jgi:hypothetical protein
MGSAGIAFNSAGIAQRVSESAVISVSVQSMNYGDIQITTVANPEGNIGFFSPRSNVFNVGYAKAFSSSIYGGINFKVISESISNLYEFAINNPEKDFLIAYSGEGKNLNYYTPEEMAELFANNGNIPNNIVFELGFLDLVRAKK